MTTSRLQFRVEATAVGSRARAATFRTLHSEIRSPLFMPVGTRATVKAQLTQTLEDAGSQILLANTYHLLLRPGPEVFERFGGIHKFMTWPGSVLTDSGGFQIFSLHNARAMSEEGAAFKSTIDGRTILLSPEASIATQVAIGSDIMMALDQCIPSTADESLARHAADLTTRWAKRSLAARGGSPQALFGIVQGALYPGLRQKSAAELTALPFDGFAIGGLAVGEGRTEREDTCELTAALLPEDRPRYLMGVGTPLDILEAVHRGVDMFDCIIPTQVAQRGGAFTSRGYLQLRRGVYRLADEKLDPECGCPTCARYPRAYLHHLIMSKETLGWQLLGQHNIYFYHQLMRDIRASIFANTFTSLYRERREVLHAPDLDNPVEVQAPKKRRQRTLGVYRIHVAKEGFSSIEHTGSGERMHSVSPPHEEAQRLYIDQSALAARVSQPSDEEAAPLVIWDVGLGAAANAMAAVHAYEAAAKAGPTRPLTVVSFENDLDSLRLARRFILEFPYLKHSAPAAILDQGEWHSREYPGLRWLLYHGDFHETVAASAAPRPDLIFYDMFSLRSQASGWDPAIFASVYAACAGGPTELYTYSCSTAVRSALLHAGFFVAAGRPTGPKSETTIALTAAALTTTEHALLDARWLDKWKRSGARVPSGWSQVAQASFEATILGHPQFAVG